MSNVRITKAMVSADDCWTDHRLVRVVLFFQLMWKRQNTVKLASRKFETISYKTWKHQNWFNENNEVITELVSRKRKAYIDWQNDPLNDNKGKPISPFGLRPHVRFEG